MQTLVNQSIIDKLNAIKDLNQRKEKIEHDLQLIIAAKDQIPKLDPAEVSVAVNSLLVKFSFNIYPKQLEILLSLLETDCNNKLRDLISEAESLMK